MRIKKGDHVIVISGKDKGKDGIVLEAMPKVEKVLVQGVNMVKKHARPSQANPEGGILTVEAPVHVSNVMILDPKKKVPTRIYMEEVDGKKVRKTKKSDTVLKDNDR